MNIFGGNALCIFTQWYKDEKTGKTMEQLLSFYNDESHMKNIIKEYGRLTPVNNISSIRLNTYFKETWTLAKYLSKWYNITLYYKEPKPLKK